jgi:hypothetical protein
MKSFKDYVNYRSKMSVLEMAAKPIVIKDPKGKERKIVEVRKTPIFMDQDDIDYLENFPPVLWSKALQKRYGELLYKAHKAKEQNKEFNDSRIAIDIPYKKHVYRFIVQNSKMNDLYDRLSGDTEDESYASLGVNDPDLEKKYLRDRTHSKHGNRLGPYAFNFSGFKRRSVKTRFGKEAELGQGDGYVEPNLTVIKNILGKWLDDHASGWYSDDDEKDEFEKVDFNGFEKKLPVRGSEREWVEGIDYFHLKSIPYEKTVTVGSKEEGTQKKVRKSVENKKFIKSFRSHMPAIKPAVMFPASHFKRHEKMKGAYDLIYDDLKMSEFSDYMNIIDLESEDLLNPVALDNVKKEVQELELEKEKLESREKKNDDKVKKLNKKLYKYEKILIAAKHIKNNKKRFERYFQQEIAKAKKIGTIDDETKQMAVQNALGKFLEDVSKVTRKVLRRIRKRTPRYGVHQWNAAHFNPGETPPQKNWIGSGTVQVNKQQNEAVYEALRPLIGEENIQTFIDHIYQDLDLRKSVLEGIERQINEHRPETSIKETYLKSIAEAIIENMDDVVEDACISFINRIGRHGISYAKIYGEEVVKNGKSISEFLSSKKTQSAVARIKSSAGKVAANYCKSLIKLYERYLANKFNRAVRPENPYEFRYPTMTFTDVLEHLFNNKEIINKLHPRTSHSIEVLREIPDVRDIIDSIEDDIESSDSEISRTQDQKSTNKNIFVSLVNKLFTGLKGIFGSKPTAQGQPTGQQPQPTGQQPQPTGQQPQPTGQQPQPTGQQPTGFSGFKPPQIQKSQPKEKEDEKPKFSGFRYPWQK